MLRGAIVGLGNIAVTGHLPAYATGEIGKRMSVVAACDPGPGADELSRKLLPSASFFADLDEMLSSARPDFVDICAPPGVHVAAIETSAAKGVNILCEKPLVESPASIGRVRSALSGKDLVFIPCHQYRYSPLWVSVSGIIASGEIGEVRLAEMSVYRTQADTGRPGWNPGWRTDRKQSGGGILVDTGAHYFYLVQDFFGIPKAVTAVLRTLRHTGYSVEDTAMVTLHYDALVVQLNLTWAAHKRMNRIRIMGTKGTLSYDGKRLVVSSTSDREVKMPDISDKREYVRWYANLFGDFADRIVRKDFSRDRLEEAVTVMRLLEASYNSGVEGRTIPFE